MGKFLRAVFTAALLIAATNSYGQLSNSLISVETWQGAPSVNYSRQNSVTIEGSRIVASSIAINGVLRVNHGTGDWQVVFDGLTEGNHDYELIAYDVNGQPESPILITVTVDTIDPGVSSLSPSISTTVTQPISQFSIISDEAGSGLDWASSSIHIRSNGSPDRVYCTTTDSSQPCWLTTSSEQDRVIVNLATPLVDGYHELIVLTLEDNAGNTRSLGGTFEYYVNTSGSTPAGTVENLEQVPAKNYRTQGSVSFQGKRYPDTAVHIDGSQVVALGSGDWSHSINSLSDGVYNYAVSWVDAGGSASTAQNYEVTVDTIRPEVNALIPASGSVVTQPLSQFAIAVGETGSGIDLARTLVRIEFTDGSRVTCDSEDTAQSCWYTWDATQNQVQVNLASPLADGHYQLSQVRLCDLAGNCNNLYNQYEYFVNTSGTVPTGELDNLQTDPEINYKTTNTFTISGSRYPQTAVHINGQEVIPLDSGDWSYSYTNLADGEHPLAVKWVDTNGTESSEITYRIVVDTQNPVILGLNPSEQQPITTPLSQFAVSVQETGSGIHLNDINKTRIVIYPDNGSQISCYSTSSTEPCWLSMNGAQDEIVVHLNQALGDDRYRIAGFVRDRANRFSSVGDYFYYVNTTGTVPVGEVETLPAAPERHYLKTASYTLQGERYPDTAVFLNGQEIVARGTGSWSHTLSNLGEGEHPLAIKWVDANGAESSELNYVLFVDTIAPNIVGMDPPDNGQYPQLDALTILTDEGGSGLSLSPSYLFIKLFKDGSELLSCFATSTQCSFSIDGSGLHVQLPFILDAGEYDVQIRFSDLAGWVVTDLDTQDNHLHFTVTGQSDTEPPAAPTLDAYDAEVTRAVVTLTGQKEQYSYLIVNGEQQSAGFVSDQWSVDVALQPGANQIELKARDYSGNESAAVVANVSFNDVAPGEVVFTAVANPDGRSATLDWTGFDEFNNGADIADYLLYASEQPITALTADLLKTTVPAGLFTGIIDGLTVDQTYYVTVVARDQAGQVSESFSLSQVTLVDTQNPYAVRDLTAEGDQNGVLLSWNVPQYNEQDIDLYRVLLDGTPVADVPANTLQYQLSGLTPQTVFTAEVITVDTSSNESDSVSVTLASPFANPTDLAVTARSNAATLTWTPVTPVAGVARYHIYAETADYSDIASLTPKVSVVDSSAATAQLGGLTNGQQVFVAIVAENISGYQNPVVVTQPVTPEVDTTAPSIDALTIDGNPLVDGQTVDQDAVICVDVSDESALSRVEFYLDTDLVLTDPSGQNGYCYGLSIDTLTDGTHTLEVQAFDVYENSATSAVSLNIQLALPPAPTITAPQDGLRTNNYLISVEGQTQANLEVQVTVGELVSDWTPVNATGQFVVDTGLPEDGDSIITAKVRNRAGESVASTPITVTLDTTLPPRPLGLTASPLEAGQVRLEWTPGFSGNTAGYDIYRSTVTFEDIAAATKVNNTSVTGTNFNDLLVNDGEYYYRVVAINDIGTVSEPSEIAQISADSTPPVAELIEYTTDGAFDAQTATYGAGEVAIRLQVSEPLLTTPFLSISPDGSAPISIALTADATDPLIYTGAFTLDASVNSGTAYAVFSARDTAGNRGTDITQGAQIIIDTAGPRVVNLTTMPATPIANDENVPATVVAVFDLDEPVANSSTFAVSYQLSGDNRQPTAINDVVKLQDQQWQATLTLPANAGLAAPETLTFSFTAQDELGNMGTLFNREYPVQVYQGDLPPLATPFNFRGEAIAGGKVRLEWFAVADAVGYQLYRKAPGETELTAYQRLDQGQYHEDETSADGVYEYQLASIRAANSVESESAPSQVISVATDSVAPSSPQNLTLQLTPIGIQTNWDPVAESDVTYRLYRDSVGPIVSTDGLQPVLQDLVEPFVVDTLATQVQPAYTVVAVDEAGNESAPSNTAYLNVDLLPVATLAVRYDEGLEPVLSWSHTSAMISSFDIYLGADETGIKLNPSAVTDTSFTDVGYANNERQYAVVAVDSNSENSLARSITLPKVVMSIDEGQIVKRNLINTLSVSVTNQGSTAISNARIKLIDGENNYQSVGFSLAANETQQLELSVPGIADLPDIWNASLELHAEPNPGETVEVAKPVVVDVLDGALGLRFETEEFIRGGDGEFRFVLTNTGAQAIQLITAANFGNANSPDVVFTLVDTDDNVLALAPMRQALGDGVVNSASGNTIATIGVGTQWRSEPMTISIPDNAPQDVYLVVQINNVYANLGTAQEVNVNGPQLRQPVVLAQTPYSGTVDSITPQNSIGTEPIVISGQALDRTSLQPVANTDLKIVISVSGFEREFDVLTDSNGSYELTYQPQRGESGRYTVSALHPILTSRPTDGEFVISSLTIDPRLYRARIPYLYDFDIPLTFTAGDGTVFNNLQFQMRPEDQPTGELPVGITLTYPQIDVLTSQQRVQQPITIRAEQTAAQTGQLFVAVFADESAGEPIGIIDIIYELSEAKPALFHSPTTLELGTTLASNAAGSITLENRGVVALKDINLALKTYDGFPAPDWISLVTAPAIGDLEPGAETSVEILLQPGNSTPEGLHQLQLEITSANADVYRAPIYTAIVQSGQGGVQFKVTDMYTGTLDGQGALIQGLPEATVRLQNEAVPSLQIPVQTTDELGEFLLQDLPAGRYSAWITANNYQERHVRFRIQPGLINSQQVFLDYNLIRLEWSVNEITLEDRYEIVLNATFETDVPAAVVMLEPTTIPLPEMEPGDVYYGELTLTNYGLIRAFDVQFTPQQSDEFYQFDYLTSVIPDSIEAKEVVVIPFKVTSLKSLEQQDGSGGGCSAYANCAASSCKSRCPTGISQSDGQSCMTRSFGTCSINEEGESRGDGGYAGEPTGPGGSFGDTDEPGTGMPPCRPDGMCPER